jgi:isopentenyl-diphosphate Delta-isomerase
MLVGREDVVSSSTEQLILVDELDRVIGAKQKSECHEGNGVLHRAFSIFVFNDRNELLLQKRSGLKPLWPNYWSNTCCSHPRVGETMDEAVTRRLEQELGFHCPLEFMYKFKYQARYGCVGAEHEYCWVYFGHYDGDMDVNTREISDYRFVSVEDLEAELAEAPEHFTPWFKMEWVHIREHFLDRILSSDRSAKKPN